MEEFFTPLDGIGESRCDLAFYQEWNIEFFDLKNIAFYGVFYALFQGFAALSMFFPDAKYFALFIRS